MNRIRHICPGTADRPAPGAACGLRRGALVTAVLALWLVAPSLPALEFERWVDVATRNNPEFPDAVEHVALLGQNNDGSQFLVVRTLCANCFGVEPGTQVGADVVIDGSAIWGTGGVAVDVEISSLVAPRRDAIGVFGLETPPRLLVLLSNGDLVDLQGIWGTAGVAYPEPEDWYPQPDGWFPEPESWLVHRTGFDAETCGAASSLSETAIHLTHYAPNGLDVLNEGLLPAFAIGTEGGCVGLAGFEDPVLGFEDPVLGFDNPIISFEDPVLGFEDPVLGFDNPIISMGPMATGLTGRYDVLVSEGGGIGRFSTGDWAVVGDGDPHLTAPPAVAFRGAYDEAGPSIVGIAGEPILYGPGGGGIIAPDDIFYLPPVVAANGFGQVATGIVTGATVDFSADEPVTLSEPLSRVALGSLSGISQDGRQVLFVHNFDAATGIQGAAPVEVPIGGIQSVDIGAEAISLGANGRFFTVVIEASGDDVLDIDPASVHVTVGGLGEGIGGAATLYPLVNKRAPNWGVVDRDVDGDLELVRKYHRESLAELLAQLYPEHEYAGLLLTWAYTHELCDPGDPCGGYFPAVVKILP